MIRATAVSILVAFAASAPAGAAILRVSPDAAGPAHDGGSWANAFTTIQPALDAAQPGDEVWVKAGAWSQALTLKPGVSLYGGFCGDEALRDARNARGNVTSLVGPRMEAPTGVGSVVVDGFTLMIENGLLSQAEMITFSNNRVIGRGIAQLGGMAVISGNEFQGDPKSGPGILGWKSSLVIADNVISRYQTGGLLVGFKGTVDFTGAGIVLHSCSGSVHGNTVSGNGVAGLSWGRSIGGGAGVYADSCILWITGNRIEENWVSLQGAELAAPEGGGVLLDRGTYVVADNILRSNALLAVGGATTGLGAAISARSATVRLVNNTIVANVMDLRPSSEGAAGRYGAVYSAVAPDEQSICRAENNIVAFNDTGIGWYGSAPQWANNDVFGNGQDYPAGAPDLTGTDGNIAADPLFADAANGDYHLLPLSPARDAGDDLAVQGPYDLAGAFRIQGGGVDMGALEAAVGVEFTMADVARALRIAGGMAEAGATETDRLALSSRTSGVALYDAVRLARKVAGLEPNP